MHWTKTPSSSTSLSSLIRPVIFLCSCCCCSRSIQDRWQGRLMLLLARQEAKNSGVLHRRQGDPRRRAAVLTMQRPGSRAAADGAACRCGRRRRRLGAEDLMEAQYVAAGCHALLAWRWRDQRMSLLGLVCCLETTTKKKTQIPSLVMPPYCSPTGSSRAHLPWEFGAPDSTAQAVVPNDLVRCSDGEDEQ